MVWEYTEKIRIRGEADEMSHCFSHKETHAGNHILAFMSPYILGLTTVMSDIQFHFFPLHIPFRYWPPLRLHTRHTLLYVSTQTQLENNQSITRACDIGFHLQHPTKELHEPPHFGLTSSSSSCQWDFLSRFEPQSTHSVHKVHLSDPADLILLCDTRQVQHIFHTASILTHLPFFRH